MKKEQRPHSYWHGFAIQFLCIFITSSVLSAANCNKIIITSDPEYPPFHWYNGAALRGASIRIVTRVLEDMNIPYELRYLGPFARVLAMAQAGKVDIVTTLKDTPERRAYLTFTSTPAFQNPIGVFVASNKAISYSRWQDLQSLRGGITHGNRFGEPFDSYMRNNLQIEEANSTEANFKKLAVGRIDFFITGYYAGLAYLAGQQLQKGFIALKPFVSESDNYIAFVSASPCMQYMDEFNRRLTELVKSGEHTALIEQSLQEWRLAPYLVH